jgi:hypothetical protein
MFENVTKEFPDCVWGAGWEAEVWVNRWSVPSIPVVEERTAAQLVSLVLTTAARA